MPTACLPLTKKDEQHFFKLMKKGNIEEIEKLIQSNYKYLLIRDETDHSTPLIKAASKNQIILINLFCKYNDPNMPILNLTNKDRYTAINLAVKKRNLEIIKTLLKFKDIDITNIPNKDGNLPIHSASRRGYTEIIKILIENDLNQLNLRNPLNQRTPLFMAAQHGHEECCQFLLNQKEINLTMESKDNKRPIHSAASHDNLNVLKILLEKGNEKLNVLTSKQGKEFTPLHYCCKKGALRCCNFLLIEKLALFEIFKMNFNFNLFGKKTPLYLAVHNKHVQIVEMFLNFYKEIDKYYLLYLDQQLNNKELSLEEIKKCIDEENQELIHLAFSMIQFDIVKLYLKYFPNLLNCKSTSNGNTLINKAAHLGDLEMMKYLYELGSNIKITNDVGNRPIHRAAYCGHATIVEYLIVNCKENVDIYQSYTNNNTKRLETPLQLASRKGYLECVKVLLRYGADVTLESKSNNSQSKRNALQLAKRYNQLTVYQYLLNHEQIKIRSC
ncbi:hypothetical protein ABK040_015073 [Willaertia magna]